MQDNNKLFIVLISKLQGVSILMFHVIQYIYLFIYVPVLIEKAANY